MKIFKIFLLVVLTPIILFAEGGSVYSRYALGDLSYAYSSRRMAIGGLGLAMYDQDDIGSLNPASWSRINLTRFNIGLNYRGYGLKDNNSSAYYSGTQFAGFSLAIPIEKSYGITMALGINPYSNIGYEVTEDRASTQFPHTLYFQGKGGISRTFIGLSYQMPFNFSIGASVDYYIGNIDYATGIDFSNQQILNSEFKKTYKLSGLGGSFGIISDDLYKYISENSTNELRLAVTYTLSQEFSADTSLSVTSFSNTHLEPSNSTNTDLATGKATVSIPSRIGLGLSFLLDRRYNFLLDYLYQPWSDYTFTGKKFNNLRNLQKISFGMEYRNPDNRNGGFWDHLPLRAGFSYEQTPYVINGTKIDQLSFMGGFSLPLDNANTIDFAAEYSMRGTMDSDLVKENLIRFNVTLNLGELWFFRGR